MTDTPGNGGGGRDRTSPFLAYRYEELAEMVAADDPERIRAYAAEWHRLGSALEAFTGMVDNELGNLVQLCSPHATAPALVETLRHQVTLMHDTTVQLRRNARVLESAAEALDLAQREMAKITQVEGQPVRRDPPNVPDGFTGRTRPVVERLATVYDIAIRSLEFGPPGHDRPEPPPR